MRVLLTILLVVVGFIAKAQTRPVIFPSPNAPQGYYKIGWIQADSGLIAAKRDTIGFLPRFSGTIVMRPQNRNLYMYDSVALAWKRILFEGDIAATAWGGITGELSNQTDLYDTLNNRFKQNGNSFGDSARLGTIDNNVLSFLTNSTRRAFIMPNGNTGFGVFSSAPTGHFELRQAGSILSVIRSELGNADLQFISNAQARILTPKTLNINQPAIETWSGSYDWVQFSNQNIRQTSGIINGIISNQTFGPLSGTAVHNSFRIGGEVNQTGGANGITRGIYISPLLTSAADYRALQIDTGAIFTAKGVLPLVNSITTEYVVIFDSVSQKWRRILPTNLPGGGGGSGTVNPGSQYQLGYYASSGSVISPLTLITGNRALQSDANGLPIASGVSDTELSYLGGVTSSIQTQLNGKQASGNYITALTGDGTAVGPGSASLTLSSTGVSAGAYTNANITVDAKGRILSASNGSGGTGGTNSNIGSGYRWAVPSTNNIKTAFGGFGVVLDSTSNTNAITAKVDTTRYTGVPTYHYVDSNDGYWRQRIVGNIWMDRFQRASLGANYTENTPNVDVALDGTKMTFKSATANNFADWIEYTVKNYGYNKGRIDFKFQIDSVLATNNGGFALGWNTQSAGSINNNLQCRFLAFINGSDTAIRLDFYSNGTALKTGTQQFNISKSDTLVASIYRIETEFYIVIRDLDRNTSITESYTFPLNIGGYTYSAPNISKLRIYSLGGNQSLYEFAPYSYNQIRPNLVTLGNSETVGYGTTGYKNSFPYRTFFNSNQFQVSAGGFERSGDMLLRVPEILAINPYNVIIEAGVNDGGAGISPTVFQANIDSLVRVFQANGIRVILTTVIPTTVSNVTEANYNTAITTVAGLYGCQVVPVYASALNNGTGGLAAAYDGGDGIHMSNNGAYYYSTLVRGYINIDSSYKNELHLAKADTLPNGLFNFAIVEKGSNRVGIFDANRMNLQTVTDFGNSTTNAVFIQPGTVTTATRQLRVGNIGLQSYGTAGNLMMMNLNFTGSFVRDQTGGGVIFQQNNTSFMISTAASGAANSSVSAPQITGGIRFDNAGSVLIGGNVPATGVVGVAVEIMSNSHTLFNGAVDRAIINATTSSFYAASFQITNANGGYLTLDNGSANRMAIGFGSNITVGAAANDASIRAFNDTLHFSNSLGNKVITLAGGEFRIGDPSVDKGAYTLQNTGGYYQTGGFYLAGQNTGTNTMKLLVKGNDSLVYNLDPSALIPSLSNTQIGVGNGSNQLSGSSAFIYDGTIFKQENSAAKEYIVNTDALSSTSGGLLGMYNTGTPSASNQVLGAVEFGARISGNYRKGAGILAVSSGAWTDPTNFRTDLIVQVTASGQAVPGTAMRINGGGRTYFGANTVATATVEIVGGSTSVAPLGLTLGSDLSSPTAGKFSYATVSSVDRLAFVSTGTTYKRFPLMNDVTPTAGGLLRGNGTDFTLLALGTAGQEIRVNALGNDIEWYTPSAGGNTIYTGDGTLAGNRVVTGSNNSLTFTGISTFRINSNGIYIARSDASYPYDALISPTPFNFFLRSKTGTPGLIMDTLSNTSIGSGSFPSGHPLYSGGGSSGAFNGFSVSNGYFESFHTITTNTTLGSLQYINIYVDATSGNVTITMPTVASSSGAGLGWVVTIKRVDVSANTVTIQVAGGSGDTIDGSSSITLASMEAKKIQSVGSNKYYIK